MRSMKQLWRMLSDRQFRRQILRSRGFYSWVSDDRFLKQLYFERMHCTLNLENPKSFNEKLQWLKLHDRKPEYTRMVDKCEAKQYVAERIGAEYIIPTLGVWNRFDEIDFDELPEQFVLKCTHDSGGIVVVRDKRAFDVKQARKKISKTLARNYYWAGREWPYKDVKPRVLAEQYMQNENERDLTDYKFYCFNGEPRFLYISVGLEDHETARISFLTCDWQFAPYERSDYRGFDTLPPKPRNFERMLEIASVLSAGIPFLRVDLYEINGQVYFSELTFSPCSGFMPFKNPEHDLEIGKMLDIGSGEQKY